MSGPAEPDGAPVSGVWVALVLLVGAVVVFLVLVLTSGVLG